MTTNDWIYHSTTSIPVGALNKYAGRDIYVFQKDHPVHGKVSITVLAKDQEDALRIIKEVMSEEGDNQ